MYFIWVIVLFWQLFRSKLFHFFLWNEKSENLSKIISLVCFNRRIVAIVTSILTLTATFVRIQ